MRGGHARRGPDGGAIRIVAYAAMAVLTLGPAYAQEAPKQQDAPKPQDASADAIQRAIDEKARRAENLKRIEEQLAASTGARAKLEAEVASVAGDRAKLNAALLDAARQAQATEGRMSRLEERLKTLTASEAGIRRSLEARRGVIAEILAALQRMGRRPPPAVLVQPEDVLAVIRTSMLLGAVVPELRGEAETLAADLTEMVRLKGLIAADREGLQNDLAGWAREQQRLNALITARRTRLAEVESGLVTERARTAELGVQAKSLKELLDRMENEVASAPPGGGGGPRRRDEGSAGDPGAVRGGRHTRSRAARPQDPLRGHTRRRAEAGERHDAAQLQPARRQWRNDPRHIARDPPEGGGFLSIRWVGVVRRAVPLVWTTLDHQCRRWLLSAAGRYGSDQRRGRTVRACGGTGGSYG